jgi:hypothetical protein
MPTPISSTAPSVCDPNLASCESAPPEPAAGKTVGPPVVSIEPVIIMGDAGAQALLRRYDAGQACGQERQSAAASCPAIGVGIVNVWEGGSIAGLASSFHASLICGKDLRVLTDCREQAEILQSNAEQVIANCHDRGGTVGLGGSRNEIICEVTP